MNEEKDNIEAKDKNSDADIVIENKFFKWVENFWFYHKWHVLIAVAAILLLFIVIDQVIVRESDDIVIMTAGPYKPTANQVIDMGAAFEQILPYDFNGDGEKIVSTTHTEVYSKDQLIKYQDDYKAEHGELPLINSGLNSENHKSFSNLIVAGEYSICIIDEWLYEEVKDAGGFRLLSDLFPEGTPNGAVDDFAVRFCETDFAKSFSCFDSLPESTLICLRTPSVMESWFRKDSDEKYAQAEEMFLAILNFKPAE